MHINIHITRCLLLKFDAYFRSCHLRIVMSRQQASTVQAFFSHCSWKPVHICNVNPPLTVFIALWGWEQKQMFCGLLREYIQPWLLDSSCWPELVNLTCNQRVVAAAACRQKYSRQWQERGVPPAIHILRDTFCCLQVL